jgi:hypothetical protein
MKLERERNGFKAKFKESIIFFKKKKREKREESIKKKMELKHKN